jgi:heterodisulfide reductase subunit A
MELVRMAVGRAATLGPVHKTAIHPQRRALVIGGGTSGMTAALAIADAGFDVTMVERSDGLGGNLQNVHYVVEGYSPQRLLRDLINRVRGHERISIYTRTEIIKHTGHVGNYRAVLRGRDGQEETIDHGVVIVATGGQEARGTRYLLGQHPKVLTQLELEDAITSRLDDIAKLEDVVMIQCVRPETADYEYCSRICCTGTIKNALRIKVINPDCRVTVLYKDIITYGFREQHYTEARRRGVLFVRYDDDTVPTVESLNDSLRVTVQEPMLRRRMVIEPDLLVLSMAIEPSQGTAEMAELLEVPLSDEGFFLEAHIKMRPMDFMEEGIFVCGMAHYPKFIEDSISHALATAGRATTMLSKQPFYVGGTVATVDQNKCVGCLTCVRTCPFHIPKVEAGRVGVGNIVGAAYIEPALCHGCGTCTAECPAAAIQLNNYTDAQIMAPAARALGSWVSA